MLLRQKTVLAHVVFFRSTTPLLDIVKGMIDRILEERKVIITRVAV